MYLLLLKYCSIWKKTQQQVNVSFLLNFVQFNYASNYGEYQLKNINYVNDVFLKNHMHVYGIRRCFTMLLLMIG